MRWLSGFICCCLAWSCVAGPVALYGHRGAAGLAPENTLPAYDTALRLGVDVVDMDVGMTKDGVVVVSHDLALNPAFTTDPEGMPVPADKLYIKDLTFAELQRYDVGTLNKSTEYAKQFPNQIAIPNTHIPRLEAVIDYVNKRSNGKVRFQIELKTDPSQPDATVSPEQLAKAVVDVVQQTGVADKVEIHSFDWRGLQAIKQLDPSIKLSYLTDFTWYNGILAQDPKQAALWYAGHKVDTDPKTTLKLIKQLGGNVWCANYEDITPALVKQAHDLGLEVVVWSVDAVPDMVRMSDAKVDGIITNRPDVLRGVMAVRKEPLSKAY
ncbi:MAG: glycerophosphodiester phosphodiesterase [Legionellales bacterium]|nr:glycerophosphodiester phosphodiesterase [Legionellales bacterium]|tara:strand:- start:55203 stop:56174 length:972 start_codon:yes stop_codon:yes gene_type:complete